MQTYKKIYTWESPNNFTPKVQSEKNFSINKLTKNTPTTTNIVDDMSTLKKQVIKITGNKMRASVLSNKNVKKETNLAKSIELNNNPISLIKNILIKKNESTKNKIKSIFLMEILEWKLNITIEKLITINKKVSKSTLWVNAFSCLRYWLEYLCAKTPIKNKRACFQYKPFKIAINKKDNNNNIKSPYWLYDILFNANICYFY